MNEGGDDLFIFHGNSPCPDRTSGRYGSGIDEAFCYITTIGRRTGRPHRIEIWFAAEDERTLYVLAGGRDRADWVRNLLADPHVQVRIGERERDATARVLDDGTDEDALARRLLLAKDQRPGQHDLVDWARSSLPVAFDL